MSNVRKCCNCPRTITKCDGFVKVGDLLEFDEGKRLWKDIRELCWWCSEMYTWSVDGTLKKTKRLLEMEANNVGNTLAFMDSSLGSNPPIENQ